MTNAPAIIDFLKSTFQRTGKTTAIVAVSGGIDSAVALTLTVQALGSEHVYALLLPYGDQSIADGQLIVRHNNLNPNHILTENIKSIVDTAAAQLRLGESDQVRRGNLMARTRMIVLYDYAKSLDALVVGTENKSENYLGYFTRFGDAASDIEPIAHLTKTQVRELSLELGIPDQFHTKLPSAGLWAGQTDETELGFTYAQADEYIEAYEKQQTSTLPADVIAHIQARIASQQFKHEVPYKMQNHD